MNARASIAAVLLLAGPTLATGQRPIALHPDNPHYFSFQGKPTILVTSGEHYGAVLNRDFDFLPYLDELKARGFNLTRLFSGTYREVPGSFNIRANTLAPRPDRFVGPYARSTTLGAVDGGARFDLDRWNPDYFPRLRAFCEAARARGIVVEFVLFCPSYEEVLWSINAWNPRNNVNGLPEVPRTDVYTLKHPAIVDRQLAFVRKAVVELNAYDNLYYEVCNEPYFGGVTLDWQAKVAATIVAAEKALPNRHLIAQNIANNQATIKDPDPAVSIFNFHYARPPGTVALNYALGRPIGDDETGFDGVGDFAYRSEAWDFLLAGGAIFSHLDYSFTADHEDGTAEVKPPTPGGGGPRFRGQLAYLKRFVEGFDFARMRPDQSVVRGPMPAGITARVLAGRGKAYAIYLKGASKSGLRLGLDLPPGVYRWERHDPAAGKVEDEGRLVVEDGETASIALGPIAQDAAIRVVAAP